MDTNKKVFWRYEVSSFYQTYKINVANLPNPSKEDINVVSHKGLLNNAQKMQLCNIIKKAYAKAGVLSKSYINVQLNYVKGSVIAAIIK